MAIYVYATVPLVQTVKDLTTSFYHLARGNLSHAKAIEQGELWTQAALKLSLTAAMFFSYRFALSMGNPLLTVSLFVVNTCIHPAANIDAVFLTSLIKFISALRQIGFHGAIHNSIHAEYLSKGVLTPEYHQLSHESAAKMQADLVSGLKGCLGLAISMASHAEYFDRTMPLVQKATHYFLWLDRKIIAASKATAPHIAACFGYRPTNQ